MATISKSSDDQSDIRLLLLGKTGEGKSQLGNFLLGQSEFATGSSAGSVTKTSAIASVVFNDRKIKINDTPGLFDTTLTNEQIITEITHTYYNMAPGPHAFLIVTKGRQTDEAEKTLTLLIRLFGSAVIPYCIVIITHEDDLIEEETTLDEYVGKDNSSLRVFVNKCGGRCIAVNSKATNSEERIKKLNEILKMVDEIGRSNSSLFFTDEKFQRAATDEASRKRKEEQQQRKDLGEDQIRHEENKKFEARENHVKNQRQNLQNSIDETKQRCNEEQRRQRENSNGESGAAEVFAGLAYVTLQLLSVTLSGNNQSSNHQFRTSYPSTHFRTRVHSVDCCIM